MTVASEQSPTAPPTPVELRAPVAAGAWRQSQICRVWLPRLVGYGLVLGLWHTASGRWVPAFTLPSPVAMLREMWQLVASGVFWVHFSATVRTIVVGYALSFVVGLSVGVMMVLPWVDAFCRKWVVTLLNTPGLVFVLVATMIFGFNPLGPVTAIVLTSFPFVTVNIAEGVQALPKDLIDMGAAFHVSPLRRLRQIVIPFLAPYTFAALRYGFSIAWKIATFAELFGSSRGVGFMIRREFELFSMAGMLAWILLFCAFALLLEMLLQVGMRRYFRWRPQVAI